MIGITRISRVITAKGKINKDAMPDGEYWIDNDQAGSVEITKKGTKIQAVIYPK